MKGLRNLVVTIPKDFQPEAREKIFDMVKYHHEHFDGAGPHKRKGEGIPFVARLGSICDAFDGITDPSRKYKKHLTPKQALREIRNDSGKRYDSRLIELFEDFIRGRFK